MKELKASGEYKIFEKRSGRYAVKDKNKQYINGDEKAKILSDAGLITAPQPKPQPAEENTPASETDAEQGSAGKETSEEEASTEEPAAGDESPAKVAE